MKYSALIYSKLIFILFAFLLMGCDSKDESNESKAKKDPLLIEKDEESVKESKSTAPVYKLTQQERLKAEKIYKKLCQNCHGVGGNLNKFGGPLLSQSLKTLEQTKYIIANGKGLMRAYSEELAQQEIELVAKYVKNF